MMVSTLGLLKRLVESSVDFVVVGGMAATAHGSAMVTDDLDVCVKFDATTLERLFRALAGLNPRQRMHPSRLGLADLIRAKRALGRPKDLRTVKELEVLRDRVLKPG